MHTRQVGNSMLDIRQIQSNADSLYILKLKKTFNALRLISVLRLENGFEASSFR